MDLVFGFGSASVPWTLPADTQARSRWSIEDGLEEDKGECDGVGGEVRRARREEAGSEQARSEGRTVVAEEGKEEEE